MEKIKKQNAITLISLIITIVVMLILATVTVGAINGGLFGYAKKTKLQTEVSVLQEKLENKQILNRRTIEEGSINDSLGIESPYNDSLKIEDGEIVYIASKWSQEDIESLEEIGVGPSKFDIFNKDKDTIYYIANANTVGKYEDLENMGTLDKFRDLVNADEFAYEKAVIIENIKLNVEKYTMTNGEIAFSEGATEWTPINSNFEAILEGDNFEITGLYINNSSSSTGNNMGLFSELNSNATINNLTIKDSYIKGYNNVGGFSGTNSGTIENCTSDAIVVGESNIGSYFGTSSGGTFSGTKIDNLPIYTKDLLNASDVLKVNTKYISGNEGIAVIPKGFAMSINANERTISGGLVIHDDDDNEFVWIPVPDINKMIMCRTHGASVLLNPITLQCPTCGANTQLAGKLYASSHSQDINASQTGQYYYNADISEPKILTNSTYGDVSTRKNRGISQLTGVLGITGANNDAIIANWTNLLDESFSEMAFSVAEYHGFYVGRYETSKDTNNIGISKSQQNPSLSINWYNWLKIQKDYATLPMGVKSDMIWGCQYDQLMFFINGKKDGVGNPFIVTEYGNRKNATYENTGMNEKDKVANIYDLEANYFELTQEAVYAEGTTVNRVVRGGSSEREKFFLPTGFRANTRAENTSSDLSSRMILFIK